VKDFNTHERDVMYKIKMEEGVSVIELLELSIEEIRQIIKDIENTTPQIVLISRCRQIIKY